MEHRLVKAIADVELLIGQISKLADTNRNALGFLPEPAYAEAAARGRIWAFINDASTVCAYLMFGGRFPNLSVQQLFVAELSRRAKLGHSLIDELKSFALQNGYQTISARVAADLPANNFWENEGLIVLRQSKGGKTKDRLINERVCELTTNSLWGFKSEAPSPQTEAYLSANPQLISTNYALDLNVFFDVVKNRVESDTARRLISAALANEISLCVTKEFSNELKRNSYELAQDPVLTFASSLPTLPEVPIDILEDNLEALRKIVFPEKNRSQKRIENDRSDLLHLASCIHHKTSGFVTREKAILRVAETLKQRFQLDVLAVEEVLSSVADVGLGAPPVAFWLGQVDFRVEQLKEQDRLAVEAFLKDRISLQGEIANPALDPGTTSSPRRRIVALSENKVIGFASWPSGSSSPYGIASYLFVDGLAAGAQHFVDHVLQQLCVEVTERTFANIRITTHPDHRVVINTAISRGFVSTDDGLPQNLHGLKRAAYRGVVTPDNWGSFRTKFKNAFQHQLPERFPKFTEFSNTGAILIEGDQQSSLKPMKLFRFETNLSPLLVLAPGRPGTIVPIQETYATKLLQLAKPQLELLPGKEAPLRIERAYFGAKPGFEKMFEREGIVVFYISGAKNGPKEAIGIARITYSGKIPLAKAQLEYGRLGVLEDEQYKDMVTKTNEIGLFTFDSFVLFSKPVTYAKLKNMGCISGANLVSAQRIKYDQLSKIIEAGL